METNGIPCIDLNVGGTYYTTSLSTLRRYPDSRLCSKFSKTPIPLPKDKNGRYIIDRDGKVFRYILNFLRGGNLNLHPDFKDYDQLREEIKFYRLKEMENELNAWQTRKNQRTNADHHNTRNDTDDRREDDTLEMSEFPDFDDQSDDAELLDDWDPALWITDIKPRWSPYIPQMGDEVIYFWQGHKCYVDAVRRENAYDIDGVKFPWDRVDLKTEEPMRVIGLEYLAGTPVTCDMKLISFDRATKKFTGKTFHIRYHPMPDAEDFLILIQRYENSLKRKWRVGDNFRVAIDNKWWSGFIEDKEPLDADYPDSHFQCLTIRWQNGESDRKSPWDLETVERKHTPNKVGRGVPITEEEIQQLQYNPTPGDWCGCEQSKECERILACLDQITSLKVAKTLTCSADPSDDPDNSMVVPFPIDLKTIKKRLEQRFYRRRSALQWEVRQIEANAHMFHDPNSDVVKSAELVTNILIEVVRNVKLDNVIYLYNRILGIVDKDEKTTRRKRISRTEERWSSDDESDDDAEKPPVKKKRSRRVHDEKSWIKECNNLLEILFELKESKHFRDPINQSVFKDYADVIDHPMDLITVKERMKRGIYEDPLEFAKDIRLIISNSKAYFTDKNSEIYTMTRNVAKIFEDNIRETLINYKNAAAYKKLPQGNGYDYFTLAFMFDDVTMRNFVAGLKVKEETASTTPSPTKSGKDPKRRCRVTLSALDKPGPSGIQKTLQKSSQVTSGQNRDGSDSDIISLVHGSSDDEWGQGRTHGSLLESEDDNYETRRNKTPTGKTSRKSKGKTRSDESPRQRKLRKASTSSTESESLFDTNFLHGSIESTETKKGRKGIASDKDKEDNGKENNVSADRSEDEDSGEYVTITRDGRQLKIYS